MKKIELNQGSVSRIRWAVFAYFFLSGLCFSSWASRIPDIKNLLGLDDAMWGTVLFMIPVGQISGVIFSGTLIHKVGSRRVLLSTMIGYAISLVAIGFATTELALLLILVVFGFFANFCNIAMNSQSIVLETFCKRPIMATFHGGWSLAGLIGGALGLMMTVLGLTPLLHFSIVALLMVSGVLWNYKYLQPDTSRNETASNEKGQKHKPEKFLFLLGVIGFFGMAAEGAMTDWNGVYLQSVVGVKEYLAPIGLTAYMITMASGRFVMDRAIIKWGRLRVLQFCGSAIFVGLLLSVLFPSFVITIIAFMIVGLGTCGIVPTVYSVTGQQTKIPTSKALTIVSSISFMGFLLGPPVIGYISNATNLRYSYALIGLLGICIVVMSSRLRVLRRE